MEKKEMTKAKKRTHGGARPGSGAPPKDKADIKKGKGRILVDLEHWRFVVEEESKKLGISMKQFLMNAIQCYYTHLEEERLEKIKNKRNG